MRNFINFITRYHVFFLFVLLQVVCYYFVVNFNGFHRSSYLNSSNLVIGQLYSWRDDFTSYFELRSINDSLAAENAELRNKLRSSYESVNEHFVIVDDTLMERKYQYLEATVVNNSINKQLNYLTVNKGSIEGIKPEMGVISQNGVAGIIKDVSPHFSTAISVLNLRYAVGVKVGRNNEFGLLKWEGNDSRYANVEDMAKHVDVRVGDKIYTRGNSAVYPPGILVGKVVDVTDEPGSNYHDIKVELATDFSKLEYVYIVTNLFKEEQTELEEKSENAE